VLGFAVLGCALACGDRSERDRSAAVPSGPAAGRSSTARPDVVLITIDTLRADAPGFAGNARARTPLLDRLAAAGRVYTDTHAHSVVTLPSHTNILTGLYPHQHGVRENSGFKLSPQIPTLATLLHDAGYSTGAFVGAFPLDSRFGLNRGFDTYDDHYPLGSDPERFEMAERRGDAVVAAASAWWASHATAPRFLWVHLYDPHAPYAPPEPFASAFRDDLYHGEVAAADSFLAPLLEPLLDGRGRPAVVVVTADHGESLGEHGELTHGIFAYEATLKVPLVVWGDGVAPGRDPRPAWHIDIVPTILGRLGLAAPANLPGGSLLEPARAATRGYFEALSTALNRGWAPLRGALASRHKLIELPVPELYDLDADPREEHNLFSTDRRTAGELRATLPDEKPWPPRKGAVTSEEAAQLRNLGYISGPASNRSTYGPADDPKNLLELDHLLQDFVARYGRGDFAGAAASARKAIALRADAEAYTDLSIALRQLERGEEAVAALREALAKGLDTEQLRRALGLTLSELGKPAEAVAVLRPLAASDDAASVNALAIALTDQGTPSALAEAETLLRRQLAATPRDSKTQENLAIVVLKAGRAAEARDLLHTALAENERLPISWNTLGVALYQTGDPAGALAAWQRSVAIDARQFDALFNLGLTALEAKQPQVARQALRQFVATAPPQRFAADIARAKQLLGRIPG
jgi:arylsulfatase A-like enzyme/Flp pilus assembly protein TadD